MSLVEGEEASAGKALQERHAAFPMPSRLDEESRSGPIQTVQKRLKLFVSGIILMQSGDSTGRMGVAWDVMRPGPLGSCWAFARDPSPLSFLVQRCRIGRMGRFRRHNSASSERRVDCVLGDEAM